MQNLNHTGLEFIHPGKAGFQAPQKEIHAAAEQYAAHGRIKIAPLGPNGHADKQAQERHAIHDETGLYHAAALELDGDDVPNLGAEGIGYFDIRLVGIQREAGVAVAAGIAAHKAHQRLLAHCGDHPAGTAQFIHSAMPWARSWRCTAHPAVFDLMGIHLPNDFTEDGKNTFEQAEAERNEVHAIYKEMGLSTTPFDHVQYLVPNGEPDRPASNTFLSEGELTEYIQNGIASQFVFTYEKDKEDLDLLLSNVDDSNQTLDAIQEYIISGSGGFDQCDDWQSFLDLVSKHCDPVESPNKKGKDIPVVLWRRFSRIIRKTIDHSALFERDARDTTVRLEDKLRQIQPNDVMVVDIANLGEIMQSFVFGDVVRIINKLQLGEYDYNGAKPPKKIIIFIDELNKYASTETPKNSPILRQILDVTERGRSLGVILFAAEQFRSAIHDRVKGNCSTHAYGRTNSIETSKADYKIVPNTYKSILTRLGQGEYLIQNPTFRSVLKIKFPKPLYKQFKQN